MRRSPLWGVRLSFLVAVHSRTRSFSVVLSNLWVQLMKYFKVFEKLYFKTILFKFIFFTCQSWLLFSVRNGNSAATRQIRLETVCKEKGHIRLWMALYVSVRFGSDRNGTKPLIHTCAKCKLKKTVKKFIILKHYK